MTAVAPRWTEETEQLVAAELRGLVGMPFLDSDADNRAEQILQALADAGLLVEPGSTVYEFAHGHLLSDGPGPCLPIHSHTCPISRYRRTVHTGPWRELS